MGVLDWPPAAFWAATPHDLFAAIAGRAERHGAKPGKGRTSLTKADVARLKALMRR